MPAHDKINSGKHPVTAVNMQKSLSSSRENQAASKTCIDAKCRMQEGLPENMVVQEATKYDTGDAPNYQVWHSSNNREEGYAD
jgi:hypothetical protein